MVVDTQKIYYLANVRLPTEKAHGLQIMKTCEALARQGVAVELIVPQRLNPIKIDSFDFYSVEKNFKITRLWCWDLVSGNRLGALGFWIESWTFYRSVKKYLRGQSAGVYYTRDLSLAYWLSKIFTPVYYEIHTLPGKVSSRYRAAWDRVRGLVVISNGLKKQLIEWGIKEEKIQGASDAVDEKQFHIIETKSECRKKLNLPGNASIVVYTGHLYEWKGAALLAQASSQLSPGVQVYLVGGTTEDVVRFKDRYQSPNLHMVGWQPHQLIPYWDKAADVLVLPTSGKEKIGALYTSPMKLFEYFASGNPIVAARLPSLQDNLREDQVVFFEADNVNDLVRAITSALTHPPIRQEFNRGYSWNKRASAIKNFIERGSAL